MTDQVMALEDIRLDDVRCLVDLDDTLLDYRSEERAAAESVRALLAAEVSPVRWAAAYRQAKISSRRAMPAISEGQYRHRMATVLDSFDVPTNADVLDRALQHYWQSRYARVSLLPGALDVLALLRRHAASIELCTHGLAERQRQRLHAAGIAELFDAVLVSEETGSTKADWVRFLGPTWSPSDRYLVISDRLAPDLMAAARVGMLTVLVSPEAQHGPLGVPDLQTQSIAALGDWLAWCVRGQQHAPDGERLSR